MRYVLASKSPRRRQLLGELLDSFDILTADTDETLPSGMHPREGVRVLATVDDKTYGPLRQYDTAPQMESDDEW